jgi:hypothetical protein
LRPPSAFQDSDGAEPRYPPGEPSLLDYANYAFDIFVRMWPLLGQLAVRGTMNHDSFFPESLPN